MLTYKQYCNYFAKKCKVCRGEKRNQIDQVSFACSCQYIATAKWRFEQINIEPSSLKYKQWSDFTGAIEKDDEIIGQLELSAVTSAREKAMKYCFGSSDMSVLNDRQKHLVIHKKIGSGQNVIIAGDEKSGKTLLSALIAKEMFYAACFFELDINFQWVRGSEVLMAARWDSHFNSNSGTWDTIDTVDYAKIALWSDVHLLIIDGVDILGGQFGKKYGHTGKPDALVLDKLFNYRTKRGLPTIIICSTNFKRCVNNTNERYRKEIAHNWGESLVDLVTKSKNVVIELKKAKVNESTPY